MAILNPNYDFLNEDYSNPNLIGQKVEKFEDVKTVSVGKWSVSRVVNATTPVLLLTLPSVTFAADSSFDNLYPTLMRLFDTGVVLVIVFAGAAWALGHRPKAIELLIGVCCGYLLARNAVNIRDYLKTI